MPANVVWLSIIIAFQISILFASGKCTKGEDGVCKPTITKGSINQCGEIINVIELLLPSAILTINEYDNCIQLELMYKHSNKYNHMYQQMIHSSEYNSYHKGIYSRTQLVKIITASIEMDKSYKIHNNNNYGDDITLEMFLETKIETYHLNIPLKFIEPSKSQLISQINSLLLHNKLLNDTLNSLKKQCNESIHIPQKKSNTKMNSKDDFDDYDHGPNYGTVIGIDLGAAYSCVGVMLNGKVEIISNNQGNRITPSYVAFTDTQRLIGDAAKYQFTSNPTNTVYGIKRIIGRRFSERIVQRYIKDFPFEVINKNDKPYIKVKYQGVDRTFAPEAIYAMILAEMKYIAEAYLGKTVTHAVITVPSYFMHSQRVATKDAATIAGLTILRMITEATSSAIAYGLQTLKDTNIIVYDLGATTLDVTVLTIDEGVFEVVATNGDTNLGGQDFDQRIINHYIKIFRRKHKIDIRNNDIAMARLRREIEKAKRALSVTTKVRIEIERFSGDIDFSEVLTRAEFEELNFDLFRKTLKPIEIALKDAGMNKSDIHEIVLAGGSSRIPKIQKLLKDFFNGKEPNRRINPDEAIAYGAAVEAAILGGDASETTQGILLLDITPLSLGIETVGGVMTKLIEKNSVIPTKKSQVFGIHAYDYDLDEWKPIDYLSNDTYEQTHSVLIKVFQGERSMTEHNILLGTLKLTDIQSDSPQIEVTFEMDAHGLLKVVALEKRSGNQESVTIGDFNGLSQHEVDEISREMEEFSKEDEHVRKTVKAKIFLESAAYHLKNQLDDDKISCGIDNYKLVLYEACNDVIDWLNNNPDNDYDDYEEKQSEFDDIVLPLLKDHYQHSVKGCNYKYHIFDIDDDDYYSDQDL